MNRSIAVAILCLHCVSARAAVVYDQPHASTGTLYQSSWWDPNDSDYDQWVWDNFTLSSAQAITEIKWRGGFIYGGMYGGPVIDFTVAIFPSIAAGSEPDIVNPPLVTYETGGNAGQTPAGVFGGVTMYDYHFTLPSPFQAAAGTKYWVQIEAWQHGIPEWGIASGTGGNGSHFRWLRGAHVYQHVPGDAAFSLYTTGGATYTISATPAPANGGTIQGAGTYPAGSTASLVAAPNPGFGFLNWTENGSQVSTSPNYSFTVNADRALVANFTAAYTITTSASPNYGGSTSGGGTFNSGASVTVTAAANPGFVFVNWTWFGTPLSTSPVYSFFASMDMPLVANFVNDPATVMFDFNSAPIHTSLPIDVSVNGLAAHLSATGSGFSIQQANTMGFTPAGFSGLCVYPNSVFAADLLVSFSETLTYFSIMYTPQELGCDDSARMRVTAYMDGAMVGTNTTTAPFPGTWPTGTLDITVAGGFNSVTVHYDAHPPTCQDYGVIFLADNMLVTRACASTAITEQPASDAVCTFGGSNFFTTASGTLPVQHQWQAELDPAVWTDLVDGALVHNGIVIGTVIGATSDWMQISGVSQFLLDRATLNLRCVASNTCGNAISQVATLTVWPTGTGDANLDGVIDGKDVQAFVDYALGSWTSMEGWCACDLDFDGWVDESEVTDMVNLLLAQ